MNASFSACRCWRKAIRLQACGAAAPESSAALATHLATCARCHQYARDVQSTTASLHALAASPVEPSPHFRSRWMAAVHQTPRPAPATQGLVALLHWCRGFLEHNRRPLLALAPLWLLILALKLTLPEPAPASPATLARSPVEILRALKAQERLLAGQSEPLDSARLLPLKPASSYPRSDTSPRAPAPGAAATRRTGLQTCACKSDPNYLVQPADTLRL